MLQKNWQDLIKPNKLEIAPGRDHRVATVVAEPFERGFGMTLGNALRRVLLSSLQGAAIKTVHIDGVLHEFSSIPGVREDVTDIILNIKEIAAHPRGWRQAHGLEEGARVVRAGDIEAPTSISSTPSISSATSTRARPCAWSLRPRHRQGLRAGRPQSARGRADRLIPVDTLLAGEEGLQGRERARARSSTTKLTMMVETDGLGARRGRGGARRAHPAGLRAVFISFEEPKKPVDEAQRHPEPRLQRRALEGGWTSSSSACARPVCLKNDNIVYIGDLIQKTEAEMPRARRTCASL